MKYTIVSIDDSRAEKKDAIRRAMHNHEEISLLSINGTSKWAMSLARETWPNVEPVDWTLHRGELGIWYSQLVCWTWAAKHGDLLIFEDDAIVADDFDDIMKPILKELPKDYDFIALFVPDNQLQDFNYRVNYDVGGSPMQVVHAGDPGYQYKIPGNTHVTRAYQGYSCVANMVSQKGARKLLDRLAVRGIYSTVDCFMFLEAHQGNIDAYAHHPNVQRPVVYDWNAPSIIHTPEYL